jgi:competence ComEA-like helix-hairpin-helix protein
MTQDQQRGVAILVCVSVLVGGAVLLWPKPRADTSQWGQPIRVNGVTVVGPVFVEPRKIDVNSATAAELTELPGVGPVLADRIVAYRSLHGSFRTLDELESVKGIGPVLVSGIRDAATAEPQTESSQVP